MRDIIDDKLGKAYFIFSWKNTQQDKQIVTIDLLDSSSNECNLRTEAIDNDDKESYEITLNVNGNSIACQNKNCPTDQKHFSQNNPYSLRFCIGNNTKRCIKFKALYLKNLALAEDFLAQLEGTNLKL
jgi:hypothetical protein